MLYPVTLQLGRRCNWGTVLRRTEDDYPCGRTATVWSEFDTSEGTMRVDLCDPHRDLITQMCAQAGPDGIDMEWSLRVECGHDDCQAAADAVNSENRAMRIARAKLL